MTTEATIPTMPMTNLSPTESESNGWRGGETV
jgi:hypothetical protein